MRKLKSEGLSFTVYKNDSKKSKGYGKYYARMQRPEILSYEDFVDAVIERNGIASRGVVRGIVDDVVDELVNQALHNHSVRLSDLGIFGLSLHSKGEENAEKFTIANVAKGLELQFLPNREGNNRLTRSILLNAATLTERDDYKSPIPKKAATTGGTTGGTGTSGSGTGTGSGTGSGSSTTPSTGGGDVQP